MVFGLDNLLLLNQLLELLSCVSLRFLPGGKFVPAATFPGGRKGQKSLTAEITPGGLVKQAGTRDRVPEGQRQEMNMYRRK